ncbi:MAG: hypothetical protein OZ917_05185 [Candidatus Brocadiaceae bacterium]|nr:hypothetical protein [Candidatus Brocadiaceae bacterium]
MVRIYTNDTCVFYLRPALKATQGFAGAQLSIVDKQILSDFRGLVWRFTKMSSYVIVIANDSEAILSLL